MIFLILGVGLWTFSHIFRRLAPERRAALGEKEGKRIIAVGVVAGIVLMVIGYRWAPVITIYTLGPWATHVNNLLVLIGFYLFAVSGSKAGILKPMRHPMLLGFSAWAVGHLLVNGDVASLILFGGLLAWAQLEISWINRAEPDWVPFERKPAGRQVGIAASAVVAYGVVAMIHAWLGVWPFA